MVDVSFGFLIRKWQATLSYPLLSVGLFDWKQNELASVHVCEYKQVHVLLNVSWMCIDSWSTLANEIFTGENEAVN